MLDEENAAPLAGEGTPVSEALESSATLEPAALPLTDEDQAAREAVGEAVVEDVPGFAPDPAALIKALLFASPEFISIKTFKELLGSGWEAARIRSIIKGINADLAQRDEPFEIVEVDSAFRFRTRPQYYPWIKNLFKKAAVRRLSQAALEILSLIGYKQPVTKAELEDIRGVSVDGVLKGLLDRRLVAITGKSEKIGNAYTYGTTREFLRYFNINRVPQDLPKLSEFEELVNSTALIPQISRDGEIIEREQNLAEEDEDPSEAA